MGEENGRLMHARELPRMAPNEPRNRADHRVAPDAYIDIFNMSLQFRVYPQQIGADQALPVVQ
jgi:hypothetical protein